MLAVLLIAMSFGPLPGDMDMNGVVDFDDVDLFVDALDEEGAEVCIECADMNGDGKTDGLDIQPFVNAILGA